MPLFDRKEFSMKKIGQIFKDLFKQIFTFTGKQLVLMLVGNIILAIGLALFNMTDSNHPLHTMCYGVEALTNGALSYAITMMLISIALFILEFIFGRKYIGLGTILNMFLLGYAITFFTWLFEKIGLKPTELDFKTLFSDVPKLLILLAKLIGALLIISLGLSLYQGGNMGIAPYDSIPIIVSTKTKIPFFWCRIALDGICFVITLILGGRFGIATILTVFCSGPFITMFDKLITNRIVGKK